MKPIDFSFHLLCQCTNAHVTNTSNKNDLWSGMILTAKPFHLISSHFQNGEEKKSQRKKPGEWLYASTLRLISQLVLLFIELGFQQNKRNRCRKWKAKAKKEQNVEEKKKRNVHIICHRLSSMVRTFHRYNDDSVNLVNGRWAEILKEKKNREKQKPERNDNFFFYFWLSLVVFQS